MRSLFIIILLFSFYSSSQTIEYVDSLKKVHSDKDYIYLKQNKDLLFDIQEGELVVKIKEIDHQLFLNDKAGRYSSDKIQSSHFYKVGEIKAVSKIFNGSKYKKKKVKYFERTEEISEDFFYDDIESISFDYDGVAENGITELTVETDVLEEHFAVSNFFGGFVPCEERIFTIKVHKDIDIGFSKFYLSENIQYTSSTEDGYTTHVFKQIKDDFFEYYQNAPNPRYYLPHVYARIKSYTMNGEKKSVLEDVGDLYQWYSDLINRVNTDESEELKKITLDIVENIETDSKKVETIFKWVQKNIKYIAVEDGLGGFIPRNPKDVCEKRYGDCKDMATIIVDMMRYAGIKGHQVWVGSRDIPYKYEEIISPSVDNHMIACYYDSTISEFIYLDATNQYIPYGMPTGFIQGKEVLIRQDGDQYLIEEVPVLNADISTKKDYSSLTINGKTLMGEGNLNYSGYYFDMYHYFLSSANSSDDHNDIFAGLSKKGNNKYKLTELSRKDGADFIGANYTFKLEDYIQRTDKEIYINMNLLQPDVSYNLSKEERQTSIEADFKNTTDYQFTLNIPEGYTVDYVPENISFTNELFSFEITYTLKDKQLIYAIKIIKKYLLLEPVQFEEYQKFARKLKLAFKDVSILKKI